MALNFARVCVAGVGLIGGSMALAMKTLKLAGEIVGVGRGEQNLKEAQKLRVIDRFTHRIEEAVVDADLVILAAPVGAMPGLVKAAQGKFKKDAIITDVGSTKDKMIKAVLPLLDAGVEFVPSHPIAGGEKSGAKYSDPGLFKGRWTIIVPTSRSSDRGIEKIRELWLKLGAKVEIMPAELHDQILAAVSHLPHMVAYALAGALLEMDKQNPMLRFSAGGFRDFIRIAGSSPEMWRDICLENKGNIIETIEHYKAALGRLEKIIERENSGELEEFFSECRKVKERVEKGNG